MVFLRHSYMPRPKNSIPSVSITFSTTPRVRDLLDELVDGQMHGKTRAEVVDRLLSERLLPMLPPQQLKAKPPTPSKKPPKKKG